MTVRINKQKINLREKLAGVEDKVNFDEVVRGLGEYTGNVGIGTTSPSKKLQIQNNGGTNSYPFQILGSNTDKNRIAGIFDVHIQSTNRSAGTLALHESDTTTSVFLSAYPNANSYINNGGNVGIGTTNPANKLTVLGDLAVGDNSGSDGVVDGIVLESTSASNYQNLITHTDNGLEFNNTSASGVSRDFVFNGGDVGIGTTNPSQKLQVNDGHISIKHLNGTSLFLNVNHSGDGRWSGVRFSGLDAVDPDNIEEKTHASIISYQGANSQSGDLLFSVSNSGSIFTAMRIDSDGNVGIGTTSPSEKLEVKAPTMSLFRDINNVGFSNGIQFKFGDSVSTAIAQSYASIGGVIENNTADSHNGALAFSTAKNGNLTTAEERVRIDSDGNVGIGTTNPGGKLQVNDFQLISGFTVQTTSGGTTVQTDADMRSVLSNGDSVRISGIVYTISNLTLGTFTLNTQATTNGSGLPIYLYKESLTIKDGNVGIGTTDPISSAKLEVQGNSNGAAGIGIRHTGATADNLWRMYMRNDSDLVISSPVSVGVQLGYGQTSWSAESDESLKDNISELGLVLDKVKNYRCINYSLISNEITEANAVGFIAQDWESDFPNIVSSDEDGKLSMKYTETIPVLLKAIQEQQQIIDQLKSRIETLEQQ